MSLSFALEHLSDIPISPSTKVFRCKPHINLNCVGVMQGVNAYFPNIIAPLVFHIFDIQDFDVLIGYPLERLLDEPTGNLDVKLGRTQVSLPIIRAKNTFGEPPVRAEEIQEVVDVSPFEPPESSLDCDAKHFIEEEDDFEETIELPKEELPPPPPPIELKKLPAGLRYAFLHGNS